MADPPTSSHQLLAAAVTNGPDAVIVVDGTGSLVFANERASSGEPVDLAGRIIGFTYEDSEKKAEHGLDCSPRPCGSSRHFGWKPK